MDRDAGAGVSGMETTEDAFLGGRLTVAQPRRGSRAGVDAVFLAAACPVKAGEDVLELGSGSGVVSLAILERVEGARARGVEIDPDLCTLADENALRNGLQDRASFTCGDVAASAALLAAAGLRQDGFDHAVANPPFLTAGEARLPRDARLRRAHAQEAGALDRWIRCMAAFVKPGGSMTVIHRADALPQLLECCGGRFGGLAAFPLFSREGEPAIRVILQGRKGSRAPMTLLQGMILHESGRDFTPEAQAVLRDGKGLNIRP